MHIRLYLTPTCEFNIHFALLSSKTLIFYVRIAFVFFSVSTLRYIYIRDLTHGIDIVNIFVFNVWNYCQSIVLETKETLNICVIITKTLFKYVNCAINAVKIYPSKRENYREKKKTNLNGECSHAINTRHEKLLRPK